MSGLFYPRSRLPDVLTLTCTGQWDDTTSQSSTSAGELESYQAKFGTNVLFETHYVRDSLGRISELTETVQGNTKVMRYGYDVAGRLEKVWRNDTLISTYTYDGNGNRLSHTSLTSTVAATYDAQDRLLTYGTATYLYTANGELTGKVEGNDTTRYCYDALGNLVQVRMPNGDLIEYLIDGQNRRVGKKLNGRIVSRWLYSGQLALAAELDSLGNVESRFAGGCVIKGGITYQLITDHLGSVRMVVDASTGAVVQRIDYDEFGSVIFNSDADFQPIAYAGGLYDTETRLVKFGARDYDATTGRWTTKDPLVFGGRVSNLYEYVVNDPINKIDINGLQYLSEQVHRDNLLVGAAGISSGVVENSLYNSNYWLGNNWHYNATAWGGNRFTGARSLARSASKVAKGAGVCLFVASAGLGAYEGYQAYKKGEDEAVWKSAFDFGMSTVATFGGIPGLVVGGTYLGLDAVGAFDNRYQRSSPQASPFAPDNTRVASQRPR